MKSIHLYLSGLLILTGSQAATGDMFQSPTSSGLRAPSSAFRPLTSVQTVFRAQSGGVPIPPEANTSIIPDAAAAAAAGSAASGPAVTGPTVTIPGQTLPNATYGVPTYPDSTWNAFSPPISSDPFAPGANPVQPYMPYAPGFGNPYAGFGGQQPYTTYGANGPAPYRRGWHNQLDLEWLPGQEVTGAVGKMEQFGVDYDLGYTGSFYPGWMLTWTNEFRLRNWDGPRSGPGLPGKAFRFGWDFELESAQQGPVNVKLGITPSINSDLHDSLDSTAYQLDGRGMFIFQMDPYWTTVLGVGYWDRVKDRVIPYAGFVYRDDFWEWRLMYPETTISLFLGNEPMWAKWMYFRVEHHVEAYDVEIAGGGSDQVELNDWRAMLGFRMDAGTYSWIIEGGWVFDRDVDFGIAANTDFAPESGFIGRIGWRY